MLAKKKLQLYKAVDTAHIPPVSSQTRPDSLSFNKSNKILNCPQNALKKHKRLVKTHKSPKLFPWVSNCLIHLNKK